MTNSTIELKHIKEPLLEFDFNQKLEHPKDGLFLYGPLKEKHRENRKELRYGLVGTQEGIQYFLNWVEKIQGYIPPFKPNIPHHTAFPGFEAAFKTHWSEKPVAQKIISKDSIIEKLKLSDKHDAVYQTVSLYADEILKYKRNEEDHPDFWFVVIPEEIHKYCRPLVSRMPKKDQVQSEVPILVQKNKKSPQMHLFPEWNDAKKIYSHELNFRRQLKARLLKDGIVVQIIRETTLSPESFKKGDSGMLLRNVQDPATIAWNLCTTAFFKAGGKPWKLADIRPGVCYIGLVFKKDDVNSNNGNACCGAQMFLDSGDGFVFKGAVGNWYSPKTGQFHLSREKAAELMKSVIQEYTDKQGAPPQELFIHGKTYFNNEEWSGFKSAVPETTKLIGVRIQKCMNDLKLFRNGKHPVLRGTIYQINNKKGYLWANGYTPRLKTYPGWEVPKPLLIEVIRGESDLIQVMEDIFALTKVNFNTCVHSDGVPVTLKFADAVGDILTAAPTTDLPPLPFRHYI